MNDAHPKIPLEAPPTSAGLRSLIDSPWLVLGMLFFVTAALGLPVLWMSKAFSRTTKGLLTIVVLLYTALLLYVFTLIMLWCYHEIAKTL